MALDADHAALLGEGHEGVLLVLVAGSHDEAVVHDGAVLLLGGADEHAVAVDLVVEQVGLLDVDFVHLGEAADFLDPLEGFVHHEDVDHRGGVEHGDVLVLFGGVGAVVDHGGEGVHVLAVGDLAEDVFTDDDEGDTGGADVLLSATVDEAVLLDVDGTGHDVGAHIGHEHDGAVHVVLDFGAVDGVVGGDVEVVGVGGDGVALGDVGVGLVLAVGDDVDGAEEFGFLGGLFGPDAGLEVGGFLVEEVGGDGHELGAGAATEEEDLVFGGDAEEVAPELAGVGHEFLPAGGAVADFGDADAGVVEVVEGLDGVLDGLFGQDTGTCVEIISGLHCLLLF